jgi:hypothetical protein
MFRYLRPSKDATIPFLVMISFLIWFSLSRLFVYLFPHIFLTIEGLHIHHYTYGIILLSIFAFVFLAYPLSDAARIRFSIPLGIALAFAYDEYAMWLTLGGSYYNRDTYDAVVVITLILINLSYFPTFWSRWGHRLAKLLDILFLRPPRHLIRKIKPSRSEGKS